MCSREEDRGPGWTKDNNFSKKVKTFSTNSQTTTHEICIFFKSVSPVLMEMASFGSGSKQTLCFSKRSISTDGLPDHLFSFNGKQMIIQTLDNTLINEGEE